MQIAVAPGLPGVAFGRDSLPEPGLSKKMDIPGQNRAPSTPQEFNFPTGKMVVGRKNL